MKQGIHPNYNVIKVKCSTCGFEHEVGTTAKTLELTHAQIAIHSTQDNKHSCKQQVVLKNSINAMVSIVKNKTMNNVMLNHVFY